jgi:predicted component of type VI protein secretion system
MRLTLVVLSEGKWQGRLVPIAPLPFVVGRGPGCHLRPASPLFGERHCVFRDRGGRVFLQDCGSPHGSSVNGSPLRGGEVQLFNGDRVVLGPLAFTVRLEADTPGASPAPPAAPRRGKTAGPARNRDAPAEANGGRPPPPGPAAPPEEAGQTRRAAPEGKPVNGTPAGGASAPAPPPAAGVKGKGPRAEPESPAAAAARLLRELARRRREGEGEE